MVRLLAFPVRRIGLVAALVTLTIAGISAAQEPGPAPSTPAPQTPPGENTVPRNPQLANPYAPGAASNPAALAQQEIPGPPVHSLPDEAGRLPTEQPGPLHDVHGRRVTGVRDLAGHDATTSSLSPDSNR